MQFQRDEALEVLTRRRENSPDIGRMLWNEEGVVAVLIQEVVSMYPKLSKAEGISQRERNRTCNAITLLKTIAIDPITREAFLRSHILQYLYPFLDTVHRSQSHEYLRLSSLGLLGSLLRIDAPTVVPILDASKVIPAGLKALDHGSEMSATVAAYIIRKILEYREGLVYMTNGKERLRAILESLANAVDKVISYSSTRLLKQVLRCYIRITSHNSSRDALLEVFPRALMDRTFESLVGIDPTLFKLLERLLAKMGIPFPFRVNLSFVAFVPRTAEPSCTASSGLSRTSDEEYDYSQFESLIDSLVNEIE